MPVCQGRLICLGKSFSFKFTGNQRERGRPFVFWSASSAAGFPWGEDLERIVCFKKFCIEKTVNLIMQVPTGVEHANICDRWLFFNLDAIHLDLRAVVVYDITK